MVIWVCVISNWCLIRWNFFVSGFIGVLGMIMLFVVSMLWLISVVLFCLIGRKNLFGSFELIGV